MSSLRREPLGEQAADALYDRIRGGEWEVGAKLPAEMVLAAEFGVGRSTIREAIRHLSGRGVVATRQGTGVFVTAAQAQEDWAGVLKRADIVAVVEARIAIEVEATALAAERRTPVDLGLMTRALEVRAGEPGTIEEHVDADIAVHRSIVVAAHNPILGELFDSFTPRSRLAMIDLLTIRNHYGSAADQQLHERIVRAIADRDASTAATLTREHLLTLKNGLS